VLKRYLQRLHQSAKLPGSRQRGLSIVELLIGVAIGLFIVGGGTKLLVDHLGSNRRIIVETRIAQDLRAATDIIARDLRRASYWQGSLQGVSAALTVNPYAAVTPTPAAANATNTYSYDRVVAGANEQFGFSLTNGQIMSSVSGAAQALTDSNSVVVTTFTITPVVGIVRLGQRCTTDAVAVGNCCRTHPSAAGSCLPDFAECTSAGCTAGVAPPAGMTRSNTCPQLEIRSFDIVVTGNAPAPNTQFVRTIRESVRVRNDVVTGACS
jgi:prepilin peptidase dependent protein B